MAHGTLLSRRAVAFAFAAPFRCRGDRPGPTAGRRRRREPGHPADRWTRRGVTATAIVLAAGCGTRGEATWEIRGRIEAPPGVDLALVTVRASRGGEPKAERVELRLRQGIPIHVHLPNAPQGRLILQVQRTGENRMWMYAWSPDARGETTVFAHPDWPSITIVANRIPNAETHLTETETVAAGTVAVREGASVDLVPLK